MKLAYLGPKGSFTSEIASLYDQSYQLIPSFSIYDCLEKLNKEEVDLAVVPIENSIEGSVNQAIDYLYHHSVFHIQAEFILPIKQAVLVHPNWVKKLEHIEGVRTHPQAFSQAHDYLTSHFRALTFTPTTSTSEGIKYVSEHPEQALLGVGLKQTGENLGLVCLEEDAQKTPSNETRFWVISKNKEAKVQLSKTIRQTIMLTLPEDQAGALHRILSPFAWCNINLTKIESRPLQTELGNYYFVLDILVEDAKWIEQAIAELLYQKIEVKNLGIYSVYRLNFDE